MTMSEFPLDRRSFLGALATLGLLGSATGATAGSDGTETTVSSESIDTELEGVSRVEAVDLDTGERHVFDDVSEIHRGALDPGEYEIVEIHRSGNSISESRGEVAVPATPVTTEGDEISVGLVVPNGPRFAVEPGETVDIWAGAFSQDDAGNTVPEAGVDIDVTVHDPDGNEVETFDGTTGEDGNVSFELELDNSTRGFYAINVESEDGNSISEPFKVGVDLSLYPDTEVLATGEESTLGISGLYNKDVADGTDVTVEVGDDDPFDVTLEDGVATVDIEETSEGELPVSVGTDTATSSVTLDVRDKQVFPTWWISDSRHYQGWSASVGGFLFENDELVANEPITVRVFDEDFQGNLTRLYEGEGETDDLGAFSVDLDVPTALEDNPFSGDIEILADGERVGYSNGVSFWDNLVSLPTEDDPLDLFVSIDTESLEALTGGGVAPGTDVDVDVTLTEDGGPVANETVSLVYEMGGFTTPVPIGSAEVTTDGSGQATATVSVPANVPNGAELRARAHATVDGEGVGGTGFTRITRYDAWLSDGTLDLQPGEFTTMEWRAEEVATDDAVSDVGNTGFVLNNRLGANVLDSAGFSTDFAGEDSGSVSVPSGTNPWVRFRRDALYLGNRTNTNYFQPFDLDITIEPEELPPQGPFTVEYETDVDGETRGVVVYGGIDQTFHELLEEGEPETLTVPPWETPGFSMSMDVFVVTEDGEMAAESLFQSVADGVSPLFAHEPAAPDPGEEITFADISSTSGSELVDFEWDLTGDGTTDVTGEEVSWTYDAAGVYSVTLAVTDDEGKTHSLTRTVNVGDVNELVASFTFEPTEPGVDEEVTFTDTSSPGELDIMDREWDLTGDGSDDETGEEVTWSYDEPGDYDVTLTVTDTEAQTDEVTETVAVRKTLADYADDDDIVRVGGVREAIEDWRGAVVGVDVDLLNDVMDAWHSGEEVA